jgi:hypothetical protein
MNRRQRKRRRYNCPTGKIRYNDHAEAIEHIWWIDANSTADKKPCRVYQCDICNGWHATSVPNRVTVTSGR